MCGRFVITSAPAALRQLFGYVEQPNFPPRYNVAPTQPIPVVLVENGARHFRLMRWGLLPSWVKDPKGFTLLINARSETVLEKPAFKKAIRRRRGLIPADGYYEWKTIEGRKQPFFIHRADGEPLGFAAVFETWVGPNGEELDTVAIVTAAAGEDLAALHGLSLASTDGSDLRARSEAYRHSQPVASSYCLSPTLLQYHQSSVPLQPAFAPHARHSL